MNETGAKQRFVQDLRAMLRAIEGRDSLVNGDLMARYEMVACMKTLYSFAVGGEPAELRAAYERLRRVIVQLPLGERRTYRPIVARVVEEAGAMSGRERRELADTWVDTFGRGTSPAIAVPAEGKDSGAESVGAATIDASSATNRWAGVDTALPDEIEFVRDIMRRLPTGLERWQWGVGAEQAGKGRWHVDNERHVQNLLWLALAPALPGLKYEETLPSVGRTHPRVDLALPRLGLAIEVKFVRRQGDFPRVTEEIAADSALYTSSRESGYSRLIVLVWDNTRSTERHSQFVEGLMTFRGVVDASVVSRPGHMTETSGDAPPPGVG